MQFDSAVVFMGEAIEGAAQEMVKVGTEDKPEWKLKYNMKQLLDPDFRLPIGDSEATKESSFEDFVAFFESPNLQGMKIDEVT